MQPFSARAVIFDLDGTLTPVTSPWRLVHEAFGVWDQARAYHDSFFAGEIDYPTWADLDAALWTGHSLKEITDVLDRIEPTPPAIDILQETAEHSLSDGTPLPILILSSGFDGVARRVLNRAGLLNGRIQVIANGIEEREGHPVGVTRVSLNDPERGKRAHLMRFLGDHKVFPSEAIAVDDRAEDRDLFHDFGAFLHVTTPDDLYRLRDYLR